MRVLIVSQWMWQGPARFPRALKNAGWEVAALCRKGEWISYTRFVDRFFFTDTSDEYAIIRTLHEAISQWRPDLILPGTDLMVETLQKYRDLVEMGQLELDDAMTAVVNNSTFPPGAFRYVLSKIDLLNELAERGIRIAPQRELATMGDADIFVTEHGYPVLLKPDQGFAGSGIEICHSEEELIEALNRIMFGPERVRYCIQKYLGNLTAQIEFVAKEGKLLAWNCAFRVKTFPGEMGQTSVARVVKSLEMLDAAKEISSLLGYNGVGVAQFVVSDESCQEAFLIELNPRFSSFVHLWNLLGTDIAKVLKAAWAGDRVAIEPPRVGVTIALWPQEAMRDPQSEYMTGLRDKVDDDPELLNALQSSVTAEYEKRGWELPATK